MSENNWGASIPVYVTRSDNSSLVGSFSVSAWLAVLIQLLVLANMVGWGVYGLVELALKVV